MQQNKIIHTKTSMFIFWESFTTCGRKFQSYCQQMEENILSLNLPVLINRPILQRFKHHWRKDRW